MFFSNLSRRFIYPQASLHAINILLSKDCNCIPFSLYAKITGRTAVFRVVGLYST